MRSLRQTHVEDGYPARWPADPEDWLTPPDLVAAWVAERDGDVLGHVCVVRGRTVALPLPLAAESTGQWAGISRLFVAPAARRQGTGRALLEAASSWATTQGLQLVLDVVDDGGPAIELYEHLGWRLIGRYPAEWTTPLGIRPVLRIYRAPAVSS